MIISLWRRTDVECTFFAVLFAFSFCLFVFYLCSFCFLWVAQKESLIVCTSVAILCSVFLFVCIKDMTCVCAEAARMSVKPGKAVLSFKDSVCLWLIL